MFPGMVRRGSGIRNRVKGCHSSKNLFFSFSGMASHVETGYGLRVTGYGLRMDTIVGSQVQSVKDRLWQ